MDKRTNHNQFINRSNRIRLGKTKSKRNRLKNRLISEDASINLDINRCSRLVARDTQDIQTKPFYI